jgi:hypothetical protein
VLFPFRRPKPMVDDDWEESEGEILESAVEQSDDGYVRLLVSPQTIATSSLHVSLICIGIGREIPSSVAPAVEFYYVVTCPENGCSFSQQGVVETSTLKSGDCFVVDAGNMRWITNRAGSSPLVILRATDGGNRYSQPSYTERIRLDPTLKRTHSRSSGLLRTSTMERLKDGLRQVHDMALKYVNGATTNLTTDV